MIGLSTDPLDVDAITDAVRGPGRGAILVFHGTTRDTFEGRGVVRLEYEAYAGMATAEMTRIRDTIRQRWPGSDAAMVHRLGLVPVGEASIVIAVASPHRAACYEASRFAIDTLKERVPIWKKEIYADGSAWKANATT